MEVSKVTIRQALLDNKLGQKGKIRLRTNAIKELIRSHEAGHEFSYMELVRAAGYRNDQYGAGWAFVKHLIAKNVIAVVDKQPGKRKQAYCIPNDFTPVVNVGKTPERIEEKPIVIPKITNVSYSVEDIVDRAKQFAWQHNSDSLREFIASLQ